MMVVLLASELLVGCQGGGVKGSENLATEEFNFSDFIRVEVGSAFKVEVVRSDSYHVSITADDNLFDDYIRVSKAGATVSPPWAPSAHPAVLR